MILLALRSLRGRKLRHATTALGVMVAMGLFSFVLAAQLHTSSLYAYARGRNNMLVQAKGDTIPVGYKERIEKVPGVKRVMYMYVTNVTAPDDKTRMVLHATTDQYMTISDDWFYVDPDDVEAWNREKTGAIIARKTARDLGLKPGARTTLKAEFGPLPVTVSAISPRGYKSTGILVHHEYFAELFNQRGQVNIFWTELSLEADAKQVTATVDELFRNSAFPTVSVSASGFLKESVRVLRVIPTLLTLAGVLVLIATLLATGNTIAITVRERRAEFATLRAIGFRSRRIARLVISEVLLVCLTGGLLGAVVPFVVFPGRDVQMGSFVLGGVRLGSDLVGLTLLASALLGLLSSALPAWRAARLPVAEALRAKA